MLYHVCNDCDHEWIDNEREPVCPECGDGIIISTEAQPGEEDL